MLLYIITAEVLASFINAYKMIKGIQIGDHEIKIANFAEDTTIFLRHITYLNRIQLVLKLYENASSSKINFSKSQASAQFSLKYLELSLITLVVYYREIWCRHKKIKNKKFWPKKFYTFPLFHHKKT